MTDDHWLDQPLSARFAWWILWTTIAIIIAGVYLAPRIWG